MKRNILRLLVVGLVLAGAVPAWTAPVFPPLRDMEDWSGTYFKERKLGFSHLKVRRDGAGFDVHTRTYMHLELNGEPQITSFSQDTRLNADLGLVSFSLVQEISGNRQKIGGRVEGGELVLSLASAGYNKEKRIPFASDTLMSSTYLLNILKDGLEVGKKKNVKLFVEPFQSVTPMEYEILRRESVAHEGRMEDAFVIVQKVGGIVSTMWVSEKGKVLREAAAQGFESRNEPESQARNLPKGAVSVSSFITLSRIKTPKPIRHSRDLKQLRLRLHPTSAPDALPQDQRQRVLKVEKKAEDSYASLIEVRTEEREVKSAARLPVASPAEAELLQDSAEIQSEHPHIRALAREIAKDEKDAWVVARRINEWVFKNIRKELVDTSTALDTLRERRGECQSHTNLFAAVARAAGIPTRIVNGLVYSEELDGFGYHAWPEVFVGEWRALDPTMGQVQVDATHIKLSQGDQAMQMPVMEYVGKLEIELIDN